VAPKYIQAKAYPKQRKWWREFWL